jgi:hypothetical protein
LPEKVMPVRPPRCVLPPIAALILAILGCADSTPPAAPGNIPTDPQFAKIPARPTGTGIGVIGSKGDRTRQKVEYHGGALMLAPKNLYFIWYGFWSGSTTPAILTDLALNLGGSAYFDAVTRYPGAVGVAPSNAVSYAGSISDSYSLGAYLTRLDVGFIVSGAVANQLLPADPDGIYVVVSSADVDETSGFGTEYCGFHSTTASGGVTLKFVFVGHPDRAPTKCKPQSIGPNGNAAADAMANVLVNEVFDTIVDPEFTGWFDRFLLEPADKCAWNFGTTYTTTNGARANVALGGRDYLLQQLWVPATRGYCTLDAGATPSALELDGAE